MQKRIRVLAIALMIALLGGGAFAEWEGEIGETAPVGELGEFELPGEVAAPEIAESVEEIASQAVEQTEIAPPEAADPMEAVAPTEPTEGIAPETPETVEAVGPEGAAALPAEVVLGLKERYWLNGSAAFGAPVRLSPPSPGG